MHVALVLAAFAVSHHPVPEGVLAPIASHFLLVQQQSNKEDVHAMATSVLPAPIDTLVKAVNDGETEHFLSLFTSDGVVDDWGRRFVGQQAIRAWSDQEFIGAKGTLTVKNVQHADGSVSVAAGWKSKAYSGDSLFVFAIADGKIREMRITSN